jgi:sugar phosphate isomerase/epimerase
MKKKSLLTLVMIISVTCMISIVFQSCKPKGKYIGLQLYSIRDSIQRDVPGAIAKVATMGYKFVEPAGYRDGKFYGMDPVAFKDLCEQNDLSVLSSHTSRNLPDSTNMNETMAWWEACIDAHVAVGAKYIVQPSMGNSAYESLEGLKKWCDYFNMVGDMCNAKGIRFGYHNHNMEFTTKPDSTITVYDFMLQNTDPSKVTFEMDLYWTVVGGANPVDYFNKYPGRFELWHIKDKYEVGGEGTIMDFPPIWADAAKSGMKYGVVEVEEYNYDEFTSCAKSLEFLNNADYVVMPGPSK